VHRGLSVEITLLQCQVLVESMLQMSEVKAQSSFSDIGAPEHSLQGLPASGAS
jgi:hypothetical protein